MKGIVMTLLESMVLEESGLAVWQQLLDDTGLDGVYTAGGHYHDQQLFALVDALAQQNGQSRGQVLCAFGQHMMSQLPELYPVFFPDGMHFLDFLISVDSVIHIEVKKLYPDALLPSFAYNRISDDELSILYYSERRVCDMAIGLIQQSAEVFSVNCSVNHGDRCLLKGDAECELRVKIHG